MENDLGTLRFVIPAIDHYFIILINRTLFNLVEIYLDNLAGTTSTVETIGSDLTEPPDCGHRSLVD